MGYDSEWPFFAGLVLTWAVVTLPIFKFADTPPVRTASRVETLDGLRGFLALAVFFHHGVIYHEYISNGR